jgi:hypothetical protein
MSFGMVLTTVPGWQVALHESSIFLDRLFRIPGIRLKHEPDMGWNPGVQAMSCATRSSCATPLR